MMDEFEVFRARAYAGGADSCSSTRPSLPLTDLLAVDHQQTAARRRRHSSVGLRYADTPEVLISSPLEPTLCNVGINGRGGDVIGVRRLSSNVTVAVEPPSPTDTRRLSEHAVKQRRKSNTRKSRVNDDHDDDDEEDQDGNHHSAVITGKLFSRSQTAPVQRRGVWTRTADRTTPSNDTKDDTPNKKMTTERRDSSGSVRPDKLLLVAPSAGGTSPNVARRQSTTCTPNNLRAVSLPSPSSARRNSYAGGVAALNTSPSTLKPPSPTRSTASGGSSSRRNSAVTYLIETNVRAAPGRCTPHTGSTATLRSESRRSIGAASNNEFGVDRSSPVTAADSDASHPADNRHICRVAVLGSHEVGKTTLTRQLLTSEYLANKENSQDEESHDQTVSILLDNLESVVQFIDDPSAEEAFKDNDSGVDAFLLVYSVTDRHSFTFAQMCLQDTRKNQRHAVILLVANKQDLVRNRVVSTTEGKRLSHKRRCKFLEVSALLDHKVDEVLVTVVRDSRSRQERRHRVEGLTAVGSVDDASGDLPDDKGCLHRAAFAIFRKLFK